MDMMEIRRRILLHQTTVPAPSGLGEFNAGYVYTGYPSSQTSWTITHNLGAIPKVVIVKINDDTSPTASTALFMMLGIPAKGSETFIRAGRYYYNNTLTTAYANAAMDTLVADEQSITLPVVYSTTRSKWDTTKEYTVEVYA